MSRLRTGLFGWPIVGGALGGVAAAALDVATTEPVVDLQTAVTAALLLAAVGAPVGALMAWPTLGFLRWSHSASLRPADVSVAACAALLASFAALVSFGVLFTIWLSVKDDLVSHVARITAAVPVLAGVLSALLAAALPRRWFENGAARWARRLALAVLVGLVAARAPQLLPSAEAPRERRAAPPGSVVLVVLDTTRADALGPWGAPPGTTPNLDAFAAQGAVFEDVRSPAPWTVPSHGTLFTGRYPHEHGANFGFAVPHLADDAWTLAEEMQSAGFETAAIFANGWLHASNELQGFETRRFTKEDPGRRLTTAVVGRWLGVGPAEWIDPGGAAAVRFAEEWLARREPDRPFFLFVNLMEAHIPLLPPLRARGTKPVEWVRQILQVRRQENVAWQWGRPVDEERRERVRFLYGAQIRELDRVFGRLMGALGERLEPESYAVVVTADHGENLGEGDRWGHTDDLGPQLLHVPCIVRAPRRIAPGSRVGGAFTTLDLHAAVLDLASRPVASEGQSLVASARAPRPVTFAEFQPDPEALAFDVAKPGWSKQDQLSAIWSVRRDSFELEVWQTGRIELFDLATDPLRLRNLAESRPDLVASLAADLEGFRGAGVPHTNGAPATPQRAPLDEKTREHLRELGYLR